MNTTEKAYTELEVQEMIARAIKQDREFQAQVLRGLPILSVPVRQQWIEKPGDVAEGLWKMFCPVGQLLNEAPPAQEILSTIPADGEEFELTLNGDATDPIAMVKSDGYGDSEKWKFNGPKVTGVHTGTFKLVRAGGANLAAVRVTLPKETPLAEGQWREAFKAKFPKHDGNGPIGFAGSEWVRPRGGVLFPCVVDDGDSFFSWVGLDFLVGWRWLVRVK